MKTTLRVMMAALAVSAAAYGAAAQAAGKNMVHVHIGHVSNSWMDTPGKQGLLPTAMAEANVAATHAGLAVKKMDDLKWLKTHTRHILHAVNPDSEAKGPGAGYGVHKAAAGSAKHITGAAKADGASKYIKTHSVHVATASKNVVSWSGDIVDLGRKLLASDDVGNAAGLMKKIQALSVRLMDGHDANGDGKVTWHNGEGGLREAAKHLGFMRKDEGLS